MRRCPSIPLILAFSLAGSELARHAAADDSKSGDLAQVRAEERERIEVIERVSPAVACVFNRGNRAGGGSGVLIDAAGHGLTNFHVIASMLEDRAGDIGLPDGKIYEMEVLGVDPTGDMAMFRARRKGAFPFAEMGDSDVLRVGDAALAMGNPFLLAEDYTPTITFGIISGLHRYQAGAGAKARALRYTDCIQVDTSINPGNSGGPLFNADGRLIGINGRVSIEERGRVNVGVGYAISINQIKRFIPMWRAGLTTKHATAGFTVVDRGRRVIVDQILEGGPAYLAGIRLGDEILSFARREISSANQFASHLGVFPANWPVEVVCRRDGEERTSRFRLEDLPIPKPEKSQQEMFGGRDLLGRTPVTEAANRRAVKRAFRYYVKALGGDEDVKSLTHIKWIGKRLSSAGTDETAVDVAESREAIRPPAANMPPVELERSIRWTLVAGGDELAARCRVIAADEITDRVAVVLECKPQKGASSQLGFDDEKGDLLRVEFREGSTGRQVRYEYEEMRKAGAVSLPHRRSLYLNETLHSVEEFQSVIAGGEE